MIRFCRLSDLTSICRLYQDCFAEPPWYEVFNEEDLRREFMDVLSWPDAVFLVNEDEGEVVGATFGFSLNRKPDLSNLVSLEWSHAFYLAELFVAKPRRERGVANQLIFELFQTAKLYGFTRAVVRTSIDQLIIQNIFRKMGYALLTSQEVLSPKTIEGATKKQKDRRVILGGPIP